MTESLANGIKYILLPNPDNQVLVIGVFIDLGNRYEHPDEVGITNLAQQMMLKGTQQRTAEQISEEIESVGGSINFGIQPDYSTLATITTIEDADLALDLLADVLFNPTFPEQHFEKERNFILSRIKISEDSPSSLAVKNYLKTLYAGHPYGFPILGEPKKLMQLTRKRLADYHRQYFQPDRLTIIAMGDFKEGAFKRKIKKYFGHIETIPTSIARGGKTLKKRGRRTYVPRDTEQSFICYGYLTCPAKHKDTPALRVASAILGEGMSSRLFTNLRDKKSLAYEVGAQLSLRKNEGNFLMYIGTHPDKGLAATLGMRNEIDRLKRTPVPEEELQRAKNYIIGKFQIAHQSNGACVGFLGNYEYIGLSADYDKKFVEKIRDVTPDEVKRAAQIYFRSPVVIEVGQKDSRFEFR